MRTEFLAAAQELSIDIAFQRESIFRRNRRLFAFDMDSTLIQGEVLDELAKIASGRASGAHYAGSDARRVEF
jgi:phosphoserine phosphatase